MHERQRKAITNCYKFLFANMSPDMGLLRHCEQEGILSDEQIQNIEAKSTPTGKIDCIIQYVKTSNPEKFQKFLEILQQNQQEHVAERIRREYNNLCAGHPKLPNEKENIRRLVFSETIFKRNLSEDVRQSLMDKTVTRDDYDLVVEQRNQLLTQCDELDAQVIDKLDEVARTKNMNDIYKAELDKQKTATADLLKDREHLCTELRETLAEKDDLQSELTTVHANLNNTAAKAERLQKTIADMEGALSTLLGQKTELQAEMKQKENQMESLRSTIRRPVSLPSLQELPVFVEEEQEQQPVQSPEMSPVTTNPDQIPSVQTAVSVAESSLTDIWVKLRKVARDANNIKIKLDDDENIIQNIHRVIDALVDNVNSSKKQNLPTFDIQHEENQEEEAQSIEDNEYNGWILGGVTNQEAAQQVWTEGYEDLEALKAQRDDLLIQVQKYKNKVSESRGEIKWLKDTVGRLRIPSASSSSCGHDSPQPWAPVAKTKRPRAISVSLKLPLSTPSGKPNTALKGVVQSRSHPTSLPLLASQGPSHGLSHGHSLKNKLIHLPDEIDHGRVGVATPKSPTKSKSRLRRAKTESQFFTN